MRKLKLRQGIASILLAGTILVTGASLVGCDDHPNENSTFIDTKKNKDNNTTNSTSKTFHPGEHIISKKIGNITEEDKNNKYNEITQIEYHEGYKCVGLGISVDTYSRSSSTFFDEACIVYINEYEVECKSTGVDEYGNAVYTDFGKSKSFKSSSYHEIDDEKEFAAGTHILAVPVKNPDDIDVQYTYHEGYELVDVALTGYWYTDNEAIAVYVNTQNVKCKKTWTNEDTGESEFHEFGTPIENNKTLIK